MDLITAAYSQKIISMVHHSLISGAIINFTTTKTSFLFKYLNSLFMEGILSFLLPAINSSETMLLSILTLAAKDF